MQQKYYWVIGIVIIVILGAVVITNTLQPANKKTDNSKSLDFFLSDYCTSGNECDLGCASDSDCQLMICGGFNFVVHKDAAKNLDNERIIRDWCYGESEILKSANQKVQCSTSKKCILKQESEPPTNYTDTSNLTKPGLPPDARQPFSDD